MKIAIGSDEKTFLTDEILELLVKDNSIMEFGALIQEQVNWPTVAMQVGESVVKGISDVGIIFCWTGTGVSIAANKIPGVRAALCNDAETARGSRQWNDANVLVMSLRLISLPVAKEILDAWFSAEFLQEEVESLKELNKIEKKFLIHF